MNNKDKKHLPLILYSISSFIISFVIFYYIFSNWDKIKDLLF